ncbi:integral membrane protein [Cordyceps fumosorosea ARSEF 2679]|uniref:Integral membrane protein n=1 Tax=Cordyceps fumosorosea (strain ARSEF 2679) TaxID=1081104 RepID=A0A167R5M9_CORFA|nr:integral membrane protein [Cordyceps fumosorosea ARSEF 2679]OAA58293.1 integral membrane protein [Cordyceps fumosorosea ARSEF 2679]
MDDIKQDLPTSMIMAAFIGIAWYIGIEINASLFLLFKRRRGLYFWSCALTSWGVILQPVFIILADFSVWRDAVPSITMIYLTWFIMVIPQSWVLYSRLHLLMHTDAILRIIKYVLIFNSIVFSIPTMVIGTVAQATTINPHLTSFNLVWDRVQLVVFFVQETALSILYIFQTRKYLKGRAPLRQRAWSTPSTVHAGGTSYRQTSQESAILWQLIWANTLIIALDITLLGIQCADLFHLQGAFKPCVYGVKLKLEFVILNRLINTVRQPTSDVFYSGSGGPGGALGPGSGDRNPAGALGSNGSHGSSHLRGSSLWQKTEPGEDTSGVQLVQSPSRTAGRDNSVGSEDPIYHRAEAV